MTKSVGQFNGQSHYLTLSIYLYIWIKLETIKMNDFSRVSYSERDHQFSLDLLMSDALDLAGHLEVIIDAPHLISHREFIRLPLISDPSLMSHLFLLVNGKFERRFEDFQARGV